MLTSGLPIAIKSLSMLARLLISIANPNPVWSWLHRLGGPGLVLLGIVDNSVIPVPGSMDVFVIVLTAHNRQWWPYYVVMAVLGAVLGGYLTYRASKIGGT